MGWFGTDLNASKFHCPASVSDWPLWETGVRTRWATGLFQQASLHGLQGRFQVEDDPIALLALGLTYDLLIAHWLGGGHLGRCSFSHQWSVVLEKPWGPVTHTTIRRSLVVFGRGVLAPWATVAVELHREGTKRDNNNDWQKGAGQEGL